MRASIVVPVYNGAELMPRCLAALASQTWPHDDYEIVVVDDGSIDDTAAVVSEWFLRHPQVRTVLVRQENAGPAVARNHGASTAKAPLVFFTDADCAPEPDWLEQMAFAFADPAVAGAKGAYLSDQTGLVPRFVQAEYEDRYDRMRGQEQIDFVDTYSAGYRREVFLENGGFDPIFPTASVEDQEFSFRLADKGCRLVFVPDARVWHLHDETVREYARRKYYIGFWKALVTKRHPERILSDSHTPQTLKAQMLIATAMAPVAVMSVLAVWFPRLRFSWRLAVAGGGAFGVLSAPFVAKLVQRSWRFALVGPILLTVRSAALGAGYFVGTLRFGRDSNRVAER